MDIDKIVIFYHISLEGNVKFGIHFYASRCRKWRYIFRYNIERLIDDMIFKGFKESYICKNDMSTDTQVFSVEYIRK